MQSIPGEGDSENSDEEFDPESFYRTGADNHLQEEVMKFRNSTSTRCLPRRRLEIAREYPIPDLPAARAPSADMDISSTFGRRVSLQSRIRSCAESKL